MCILSGTSLKRNLPHENNGEQTKRFRKECAESNVSRLLSCENGVQPCEGLYNLGNSAAKVTN